MRIALALLLLLPMSALAVPTREDLGVPPDALSGDLAARTADRLVEIGRLPSGGAVDQQAVRMALIGLQQDHLLAPTGWLDADTANLLGVSLGSLPDDAASADVLDAAAHEQEALRLRGAAAYLQRLAAGAGTPEARGQLLVQAEKAREVARQHAAVAGGAAATGVAPPVVPDQGLTRAQITALQLALGVPDSGVLDDATRTALSSYQARHGRAATGALDVQSLSELLFGASP